MAGEAVVTAATLLVVLVVGLLIIRRGYQQEARAERWGALEAVGKQYEQEQVIAEFIEWMDKEHGIVFYVPEDFFPAGPISEERMRELVAEFMDSTKERDAR